MPRHHRTGPVRAAATARPAPCLTRFRPCSTGATSLKPDRTQVGSQTGLRARAPWFDLAFALVRQSVLRHPRFLEDMT